MKKIYSLFILSILALTMFVGCQMPTDGTETTDTFNVSVNEDARTLVTLSNETPKAFETVYVTVTIPEDYSAEDLEFLVKNGKDIETNDEASSKESEVVKSFIMPACDVTVIVNFEKKATQTDDDDTPTVDADEATYGFVKTVNYTVVANGQSLPGTKTGAELIAIAKAKKMVKDTDYTINGTTVTLTASGVGKYLGYSLSVNASEGYLITGGGMKEAGKTVTLSITHRDGNDYKTPTELYLVKVSIKEGETNLDIPVIITKDHKIQFTMPEKKINVFAQFCDIRYQLWEEELNYKACVTNLSGNKVMLALCFNSKVYDNLEPVDGKFVLEVVELETGKDMCFTSLCDDYGIGVITTDGLTILESSNKDFVYNPDASQIK